MQPYFAPECRFRFWAAEAGSEAAGAVPLALCIPFVGLLLCIAVLPLVKAEWWEKHQIHAVVLWSLLFIVPFAVRYGSGTALETVLECLVGDYLTFIVLLFRAVLCVRKYWNGRGFGRFPQNQCGTSDAGNLSV